VSALSLFLRTNSDIIGLLAAASTDQGGRHRVLRPARDVLTTNPCTRLLNTQEPHYTIPLNVTAQLPTTHCSRHSLGFPTTLCRLRS